jgi:transposase
MQKEYGYQHKSKRLLADRKGQRGKRISVLSALDHNNNLVAPMIYDGYTTKEVFKTYLIKMLLPKIKNRNMTIILDNASFHKGSDIEKLVKESGNNLKFLPPYSPDLNPIEKKWAQVKTYYRKLTYCYEDKMKLIEVVLSKYSVMQA